MVARARDDVVRGRVVSSLADLRLVPTSKASWHPTGAIYTAWMGGMGAGLFLTNFLLDRQAQLAFWLFIGLLGLALLLSFLLAPPATRTEQPPTLGDQLRDMYTRLRGMGPLLPGMVLQTLAAGMLVPVLPSFVTRGWDCRTPTIRCCCSSVEFVPWWG